MSWSPLWCQGQNPGQSPARQLVFWPQVWGLLSSDSSRLRECRIYPFSLESCSRCECKSMLYLCLLEGVWISSDLGLLCMKVLWMLCWVLWDHKCISLGSMLRNFVPRWYSCCLHHFFINRPISVDMMKFPLPSDCSCDDMVRRWNLLGFSGIQPQWHRCWSWLSMGAGASTELAASCQAGAALLP